LKYSASKLFCPENYNIEKVLYIFSPGSHHSLDPLFPLSNPVSNSVKTPTTY